MEASHEKNLRLMNNTMDLVLNLLSYRATKPAKRRTHKEPAVKAATKPAKRRTHKELAVKAVINYQLHAQGIVPEAAYALTSVHNLIVFAMEWNLYIPYTVSAKGLDLDSGLIEEEKAMVSEGVQWSVIVHKFFKDNQVPATSREARVPLSVIQEIALQRKWLGPHTWKSIKWEDLKQPWHGAYEGMEKNDRIVGALVDEFESVFDDSFASDIMRSTPEADLDDRSEYELWDLQHPNP